MYKLYDFLSSGNGYKVRLTLTQSGIPYSYHEVNVLKGETREADFMAINPNGRIPVLVTPEGDVLTESNAIICYLAEGTELMPLDKLERARVMQWLFWEQYSHEPFIATSRFWMHLCDPDEFRDKLAERRPGGEFALRLMDKHLEDKQFLVADTYSVADIALYANTHVAHEGGFTLAPYPAVRAWLNRVAAQPDHLTIDDQGGV